MTKEILTQARLKELFDYDGENLIWRNPLKHSPVRVGDVAGWVDPRGYRTIIIKRKPYYSHRLIWFLVYGDWPKNEIDHIDQNPLNNKIENLRDVSKSINQRNAKKRINNTSGITGVSWDKVSGKWMVRICFDKKQRNLGLYTDKYRAASIRHFAMEIEGNYTARHGK